MAVSPALRRRRDDVWCLTWRNCSLMLWKRLTIEGLQAAHEVTQELHRGFPQGLVTISCMLPGSPLLPSSDVRTESLRLINAMAGVVKASAAVYEGTGLVFAASRIFFSAVTVATTRSDQHFRVFAKMEKVPPWIAPFMDPEPTAQLIADLTEAVVRARAMYGGAPQAKLR